MKKPLLPALFLSLFVLGACQQEQPADADASGDPTAASPERRIERLTPKIDELIPADAEIEILGEGFQWSEGPVWVQAESMLLFSDVPANTIYRWTEADGVEEYLTPSGYTGDREPAREGANGLALDNRGRLLICQHGDRRIARMKAPWAEPAPRFETVVNNYQGKRFNSPNDLAVHSGGAIYFTDPPYGLPGKDDDPEKELPFNGVYRAGPDGEVQLLDDQLTRPNGIAFSPDEKTLYVANSDPEKAVWMVYNVDDDGGVEYRRQFFDATSMVPDAPGLPDGLKVDRAGYVYATGPGGVLIFSPDGEHLGTVQTGVATANVALNNDESALYMTAHQYLMRVPLK